MAHDPPAQQRLKPVLAVSSEVGVGAVGLSIARYVFAKAQIPLIGLPTVMFAARPGLGRVVRHDMPPDFLEAQFQALLEDGQLDDIGGVLTGYFATAEQVHVTARFLNTLRGRFANLFVVVDPIIGDFDTGLYVNEAVAVAVREALVPVADVITPNGFEFLWLSGLNSVVRMQADKLGIRRPGQDFDWQTQFDRFAPPDLCCVVTSALIQKIEGAPLINTFLFEPLTEPAAQRDEADGLSEADPLRNGDGFSRFTCFSSRYFEDVPNGTGDVFTAIMLTELMRGKSRANAVATAVSELEKIADKAQGFDAIAPYLLL